MYPRDFRVLYLNEWKSGHNAVEAARNINCAFGEGSANERTIRRWYAKFESGDKSLEIEDRGKPKSALNDEVLQVLVEANPRQTVRELSEELNVSIATISRHLKLIGKVKKMDKWVPYELNKRQKICNSLLIRNDRDPFLDRIVTCDEKWMLYDNRRRSAQWLDADENPKHMSKPSLHPKKTIVTV
ncbi:histone-lysine N-methyltransferase SETMAR-like [Euwallacea similis]|uniref:histone-lysine N-methyltransferase SETMAR-like n=1 Tax=Euwallacea similis TaxID=1736056 RepID=UPI00344F4579